MHMRLHATRRIPKQDAASPLPCLTVHYPPSEAVLAPEGDANAIGMNRDAHSTASLVARMI